MEITYKQEARESNHSSNTILTRYKPTKCSNISKDNKVIERTSFGLRTDRQVDLRNYLPNQPSGVLHNSVLRLLTIENVWGSLPTTKEIAPYMARRIQ